MLSGSRNKVVFGSNDKAGVIDQSRGQQFKSQPSLFICTKKSVGEYHFQDYFAKVIR